MFVDSAVIEVRAGKGGDGCLSFRREKFVPKGGPDGGDGGRGGSVVAVVDPNVQTLLDFQGRHHWRASNGEPGRGKDQTGAGAADIVLRLPGGTLVYDEKTGELLTDLTPGDRVVLARGGEGGFGNAHFKSAINQTPRQTTPGAEGEAFTLALELKLIADVGLVGKPNAGKSTLLSAVSRATPKIADYPFTTLKPHLGIAELDKSRRLVIADLPGLIEGASRGAGLGHSFLRHIERTRLLVHVIEIEPTDGSDPVENYHAIRDELLAYSSELAAKEQIVAVSKLDLLASDHDRRTAVSLIRTELGLDSQSVVLGVSGVSGEGVGRLLTRCWEQLGGVEEPGWREM